MKKILIIGVVLLLLFGGGGAGLYFTGMLGGVVGEGEEHAEADAAEGDGHGEAGSHGGDHGGDGLFQNDIIYVQLDPMAAPIIVDRRIAAQVILTLSVQVKDLRVKNDVVRLTPRLRDAMLSELYSAPVTRDRGDGAIDIMAIKERMLAVARGMFTAEEIVDVLVVKAVQTS